MLARRHVAVALVGLIVLLAGCSERDAGQSGFSVDPTSCLSNAGLETVEERGVTMWRGTHDAPFYMVIVQALDSRREAKRLAADAVDVYAASAGRYVVTRPSRPSVEGHVDAEQRDEDERIVQDIAACLGG